MTPPAIHDWLYFFLWFTFLTLLRFPGRRFFVGTHPVIVHRDGVHEGQNARIARKLLQPLAHRIKRLSQARATRRRHLSSDREIPRVRCYLVIHRLVLRVLPFPELAHHHHDLPLGESPFQAACPNFDTVDESERKHLGHAARVVDTARLASSSGFFAASDIRKHLDIPGQLHKLQKPIPVVSLSSYMLALRRQEPL